MVATPADFAMRKPKNLDKKQEYDVPGTLYQGGRRGIQCPSLIFDDAKDSFHSGTMQEKFPVFTDLAWIVKVRLPSKALEVVE